MKSKYEVDESVAVDTERDEAKPETNGTGVAKEVNGAEPTAAAAMELGSGTEATAESEAAEPAAAEPGAKTATAVEPEAAEPEAAEPEAKTATAVEPEPDAKTEPENRSEPAAEPSTEPETDSVEPPPAALPGSSDRPSWRQPATLLATTKSRILAGVVLVVVLALAGGGFYWFKSTHLAEGVAFRVDGQDVTVSQLDDDVQTDKALFGVQPPTEGPKLDQFRRDFAKATAVSMIIDKAAADRQVAIADRQVSDVLARYITQYYGEGPEGHDKYVQALGNQGTSEAKVLAELKRQMVLQQLVTQVTSGVTVSDQDVRQAFDQRHAQLGTPELRDIHNIVVASQVDADQVVAQLNSGANFEQVAQQRSMDDSTKDKGGDLGPVSAQDLEPQYAAQAFGAPVGAVFGPVQTRGGFNVGRVIQAQPPQPAVFDKIKDQLRQRLISEKSATVWGSYLTDLIKKAGVRYSDTYRPADPDALPSAGQPAPSQQGAPAAGQPAPAPAPAPAAGQPAPAGQPGAAPAPAGQPGAPAVTPPSR
jgi:peptidyl-prolyl cis-trans isomerase C